MDGNIGRTDANKSSVQWQNLVKALEPIADIVKVDPAPGLPDMVFTSNAGLALNDEVILSRFAHAERQPEEELFRRWFEDHQFRVHELPRDLVFEGGGDAIFDPDSGRLFVAYGNRTALEAHPYMAQIFNVEVISLRLVDPRFYHLDTCFLPLPGGNVLWYPPAFDIWSNNQIKQIFPPAKQIPLSSEDADNFAANATLAGKTLIINRCSDALRQKLNNIGFSIIEIDLTEFIKAGGAARCLTLDINQRRQEKSVAQCQVATRTVEVSGQLVDSQLMSKICDAIVDGGGSFKIQDIHLGLKRDEPSTARIEVTAPDSERLETILQRILRLGARTPSREATDAVTEKVIKKGVAPSNFYTTTIFATQVRIDGKWADVNGQRMDAAIVIEKNSARCVVMRELNTGDDVVTGSGGIRTIPSLVKRKSEESFAFMSSGVSSERRVETAVERIAWDMRRIRARQGKIVVVAGPVVAHTGGADRLSWLVRNGYIGAFLGGNAIAAHDIELAFYGTSLGVDMMTGRLTEGGRHNHLYAINKIRAVGSIKEAVEKKILTSGIFYELTKNNTPFSLAGSVRDDGPLPETEMNLITAQTEIARLIKGADMILALSTMLHAIGVGNMTPAGVKFVCVDINPSVMTKLADRGSLESIGVVTDVGLFLTMLVSKLKEKDFPEEGEFANGES